MTELDFEREITRLESQWRNSYGEERKALLWTAFRDCRSDDFHDAVSNCLAGHRQVPLLAELSRAVDEAKTRREQNRYSSGNVEGADFASVLSGAARITHADPEFVKGCMKLIREKFTGKATREHFDQGVKYFEQVAGILKRRVTGRDLATGEEKDDGI